MGTLAHPEPAFFSIFDEFRWNWVEYSARRFHALTHVHDMEHCDVPPFTYANGFATLNVKSVNR